MVFLWFFYSTETEDNESKVILNSSIKFIDEHSMESDEDQRVVDHLSPQTLLETPADSEVHYSFRSPEGNAFLLLLQKKWQYCFIRIVDLFVYRC